MASPSLADLRDIHLPPPPWLIGLLPADADPVTVLAAALALMAVGVWGLRRYVVRRRQRRALRALSRLAAQHRRDGDATRLARGLSQLLRRHALDCFPAAEVAGLTGGDWLKFLDAHGGRGRFADGVGAVLVSRPYQDDGAIDAPTLIALVQRWLSANPA